MSNKRKLRKTQAEMESDVESFLKPPTLIWLAEECPTREGMLNVWECRRCHWKLVVIHKDTGVTPMFLTHREEYGGGR